MTKHNNEPTNASTKRLFADPIQRKRYIFALGMILLMVGAAELLEETEVIFPEMAALTIGMWIIDKRVWRVKRWQMVTLMGVGAIAGVCLVRYSSLPLIVNLCLAFLFAAASLFVSRATLVPVISACMLPVLLRTESWVYPAAVFVMSLIVVSGQKWMEKGGIRHEILFEPAERFWKKDMIRWASLLTCVLVMAAIALFTASPFLIVPPLIVAFVEFTNSKAGFRNRPVQMVLLLVTGALLGTFGQLVGHYYLSLPESVVALFVFVILFTVFELVGKFFAPVGALALLPMLLPEKTLIWFPLQVAAGSILFIGIGLIFFMQCYKWPRAQLVYCLTPVYLRDRLPRTNRGKE